MGDPQFHAATSVINYVCREIREVHRLCDREMVPRRIGEELLSLSQRVKILADSFGATVKQLHKAGG